MTTLVPKYDQGASGAVNRAFNLKLQENVSVMDFGAKGDGSTDDTTAIQNAINAVGATGGIVFFPIGTYNISLPLVLPATGGLTLKGYSRTQSKIVKTTTTAATGQTATIIPNGNGSATDNFNVDAAIICLHGNNSYYYGLTIEDLFVQQNSSSSGYCIYAPRLAQSSFNMSVFVYGASVFYSQDFWNSRMTRCDVQSGTYGIVVNPNPYGGGTSLTFESCFVSACTYGYYFVSVSYSSLISCACDNTPIGGTAYSFTNQTSNSGTGCSFTMVGCGDEVTAGRHLYCYSSFLQIIGGSFGPADGLATNSTYYAENYTISNASRVAFYSTNFLPKNSVDQQIGVYDTSDLVFMDGNATKGAYTQMFISAPSTATVFELNQAQGYLSGNAGSSTPIKLTGFYPYLISYYNFSPVVASTVPNACLYVDSSTNKLSYKDNTGTVHTLY
jgi:hypothetical protein